MNVFNVLSITSQSARYHIFTPHARHTFQEVAKGLDALAAEMCSLHLHLSSMPPILQQLEDKKILVGALLLT
jgi:hypothetical protein